MTGEEVAKAVEAEFSKRKLDVGVKASQIVQEEGVWSAPVTPRKFPVDTVSLYNDFASIEVDLEEAGYIVFLFPFFDANGPAV